MRPSTRLWSRGAHETMGASFAYHAAALYSKVAHEASAHGIQVNTKTYADAN